MTGGQRRPYIRREDRECPLHGRTEHALYAGGNGSSAWSCMLCNTERAHRVAAGECMPRAPKIDQVVHHGRPCPTCFTEMPLTGVCDNCD